MNAVQPSPIISFHYEKIHVCRSVPNFIIQPWPAQSGRLKALCGCSIPRVIIGAFYEEREEWRWDLRGSTKYYLPNYPNFITSLDQKESSCSE